MNDCCWPLEVELELAPIPPRPELREELDGLDGLDGLDPEVLDDELVFCAHAVPAIRAAVMQNREVLSNAFFIVIYFLLFVGFYPLGDVLPRKSHHPMTGKVMAE
jgi:hypothetical protein